MSLVTLPEAYASTLGTSFAPLRCSIAKFPSLSLFLSLVQIAIPGKLLAHAHQFEMNPGSHSCTQSRTSKDLRAGESIFQVGEQLGVRGGGGGFGLSQAVTMAGAAPFLSNLPSRGCFSQPATSTSVRFSLFWRNQVSNYFIILGLRELELRG